MLALTGGNVYTASHGFIPGATILVKGGLILAVGQRLSIPQDARVIDVTGKTVTPGFVDCHTHLGLASEAEGTAHLDKNEINDPVCPHLRVIDGISSEDQGLTDARSAGITSVVVLPGSESLMGGLGAAIKTQGTVIDHMLVRHPAALKAAFGENPIATYLKKDRPPSTRMTVAGMMREAFAGAKAKKTAGLPLDLRDQALVLALERAVPLRAHAHAADDIMTAIRLADEFGLDLVIDHATSAHKIASELAVRSIPAVVGPSITARVKVELKDRTYQTPALLYRAGVKIALMTDHPILPVSSLRIEAALAIREGLPRDAALQAITLAAAEIAGISGRVGSIESGKDADLLIFDGDPFNILTPLCQVLIDGTPVHPWDFCRN